MKRTPLQEKLLAAMESRRDALKLSKGEVGRRAFGPGKEYTYKNFLYGRSKAPSIETIVAFAEALDTTVGALLGERETDPGFRTARQILNAMAHTTDEDAKHVMPTALLLRAALELIETYSDDRIEYSPEDFEANLKALMYPTSENLETAADPTTLKTSARQIVRLSDARRKMARVPS